MATVGKKREKVPESVQIMMNSRHTEVETNRERKKWKKEEKLMLRRH